VRYDTHTYIYIYIYMTFGDKVSKKINLAHFITVCVLSIILVIGSNLTQTHSTSVMGSKGFGNMSSYLVLKTTLPGTS
jgi:hypothetical protein